MRKLPLAALAVGAMFCLGLPSANAAPPATTGASKSISQSSILIEPVAWSRRCRAWNRECRIRWGWGWRYRRCMIRRGC